MAGVRGSIKRERVVKMVMGIVVWRCGNRQGVVPVGLFGERVRAMV